MPSKHYPRRKGWRPTVCRKCGESASDTRHISARGLCLPCGQEQRVDNARQLIDGEGPHYDVWLDGMASWLRQLVR